MLDHQQRSYRPIRKISYSPSSINFICQKYQKLPQSYRTIKLAKHLDHKIPKNKLFQHNKSIQPWKNLSHFNRLEEITISRLKIGHRKLTCSHHYQKAPKPTWQFCNAEPINILQLLFKCPNLESVRSELKIVGENPTIHDNPIEIKKIFSRIRKVNQKFESLQHWT